MATATTEPKSPNTDKSDKNDQVEENIGRHTDESTEKNKQVRQEGAKGDVAGGDGLQEYREQLKQRLDEELTNLEATQGKAVNRLQTENESGNIEDSELDTPSLVANASQERADIPRKELISCPLSGVLKDKLIHQLSSGTFWKMMLIHFRKNWPTR
ncbi:MAG: hypothetical protein ACYSUY_17295 [Planctomycetota bacterium]